MDKIQGDNIALSDNLYIGTPGLLALDYRQES